MAITISPMGLVDGARVCVDTDADGTSEDDINGGPAVIYSVTVDNTANGAQDEFVKLYNVASPTVGTTVPDMVLMAPQGAERHWCFFSGLTFDTALSFACVTAAGTGGTTNPGSNAEVHIAFD